MLLFQTWYNVFYKFMRQKRTMQGPSKTINFNKSSFVIKFYNIEKLMKRFEPETRVTKFL